MKKSDAEAFGAEVTLLAAGLREKLTDDQVAALFLGLLAYDYAEVEAALRRALSVCDWFPVPAKVVAIIHELRAEARRDQRAIEEGTRRKALPPGPADETSREEALAAIRRITESLAAWKSVPEGVPRRSVADMNAAVERLRLAEGKPPTFRVIDGGKP